jgi:hypothetical protein
MLTTNIREKIKQAFPYADNFEIEENLYWYCADFHEGQWSEKYSILSTSLFHPSPLSNGPENNEIYLFLEREKF